MIGFHMAIQPDAIGVRQKGQSIVSDTSAYCP
jgi:hypothetical protein